MTTTPSTVLVPVVAQLVAERPRSVRLIDICAACSDVPGVSTRWLSQLACGHIKDAPAARLERVYEFLKGKPLTLVD